MVTTPKKTAFVTGANGISGNAIIEHLIREPKQEWDRIIITSRTPPKTHWQDPRVEFVAIDFLAPLEEIIRAMEHHCAGVTHAYFTSYVHIDNFKLVAEANIPLFKNFLDAIDIVAGNSLQRVCLQTGGKRTECQKPSRWRYTCSFARRLGRRLVFPAIATSGTAWTTVRTRRAWLTCPFGPQRRSIRRTKRSTIRTEMFSSGKTYCRSWETTMVLRCLVKTRLNLRETARLWNRTSRWVTGRRIRNQCGRASARSTVATLKHSTGARGGSWTGLWASLGRPSAASLKLGRWDGNGTMTPTKRG
ncbi:NAD-dependent epimerase/dehydratase [Macrophomina phaseolina MS6]|uniref:NAD-dependent epimerase/dehydratase n=1 Tax=Macrophomina phaseolina (strain MS6) TaxID=1126212 RepID=K2R1H1_MACPH|nr:NAD-dependent epimerase/dehydratase [Macrophomina phaseolina MS6]